MRRCEVPACDPPDPADRVYEPDWLRFTTPYRSDAGVPRSCERYAAVAAAVNGTRCAPDGFDDGNATERCLDGWVFESRENTIGTEVRTRSAVYNVAIFSFHLWWRPGRLPSRVHLEREIL